MNILEQQQPFLDNLHDLILQTQQQVVCSVSALQVLSEFVQATPAPLGDTEIVQTPAGQFPIFMCLGTLSNHHEILNVCKMLKGLKWRARLFKCNKGNHRGLPLQDCHRQQYCQRRS